MDKEQVADRRLAFGQELKKAREGRGVSLPGLAQATRIRLDFVEALEDGDFAKLPGEVFGRGFVRSIGRTLGTDSERLIELFDQAWGPSAAPQSVLKVEIKNKPTRSSNEELRIKWANAISILRRGLVFKTILPLAAILVLLGAAVFGLFRGGVSLVSYVKHSATAYQQETAIKQAGSAADQKSGSAPTASVASGSSSTVGGVSQDLESSKAQTTISEATPEVVQGNSLGEAASLVSASPKASDGTTAPRKDGGVSSDSLSRSLRGGETSPGLSSQTGGDQQVLELVVTEPVRIRLEADEQPSMAKELTPDTYRFTFGTKADLMIYDAAALKVLFNGKSLGSLGHKGRIRRLSFQAEPLKAEKKL